MILTLYYMYATILQWWRLGVLQNKLNGTLSSQNALLVATGNIISDKKNRRCLENLLFNNENRIGCTVIPKQKINLINFAQFPKDLKYLPLHIKKINMYLENPKFYLLVTAKLETYIPHQSDLIQIENYGELIGWKAADDFQLVLKTDINHLTKLVYYFFNHNLDINHDMELLKIETVNVEGNPFKLRYEKKYDYEQQFKYSCAPIQWNKYVDDLKDVYSKHSEITITPKITIENGNKIEDARKVPISEVKPIKKESKKLQEKNENRLEVDSRKHQKKDHKSLHKSSKEREKESVDVKDGGHSKQKDSTGAIAKKDIKQKDEIKTKTFSKTKSSSNKDKTKEEIITKDKVKEPLDATQKRHVYKQSSAERKQESEISKKQPIKDNKLENNASNTKLYSDTLKTNTEKALTKNKEQTITKDTLTVSGGSNSRSSGKINEASNSKSIANGNVKNIKPPNVLVYADSLLAKENVKTVLNTVLNRDKYTVYDLPTTSSNYLWDNSTSLVVVCGGVTEHLMKELLQFLVSGGQLLCLCSDLLHGVLKTFTTAEVREHELVRFSYGEWKRVRMMHHIFCYQASPAKKQFSKDSDHSHSSNGSSPIAPRTPSVAEIQHGGKSYTIQVQVLGTEETWETPSLLLACVKNTRGRAVFSQVHLEIDPTEYQDDENKYAALKDSNQARLEILKDILSKHLDMDCNNDIQDITYSPAYFLGRHDLKLQLINECDNIKNNTLELEKYNLNFCGKNVEPGVASYNKLPVLIHSCPTNFSTVQYFEILQTENIGRLVLYSDVMTSSQYILSKKLEHGIVVIPRQQNQGIGRSNNCWLSPPGCAMFSLQMHIPLKSTFGESLSLIQHFVMVSIVHAIKKRPGYENLEIGIKWPNDLYAYSSIKIGGLLVTTFVEPDVAIVNIGCGVNLNNSNPTTCINNIIQRHNDQNKTKLPLITYEGYFASTFNEIEELYKLVQNGQIDHLFDLYYKYWLHSEAEIKVSTSDGNLKDVTIIGVDEFGFLKVKAKDGTISNVQPDGNSFDMLKGLIAPKLF